MLLGLEVLILLVLIGINGLFALSELALVSARRARLAVIERKGVAGAAAARRLIDQPQQFLPTVQIGVTLIGVLTGVFGGAQLAAQLAVLLARWKLLAPAADTLSLVIVVVLTTYLTLVLGELVPKQLALRRPEHVAARVARPIAGMARVTAPVIWLLGHSTALVLRALGQSRSTRETVTEEELRALLAEGAQAGVLEMDERDMIERVLRLALLALRRLRWLGRQRGRRRAGEGRARPHPEWRRAVGCWRVVRAPRALCRLGADVRVLLPGYPSVLAQSPSLRMLGQLPGRGGMPACRVAETATPDGLIVYVLIAPSLYQRAGSAYAREITTEALGGGLHGLTQGLSARGQLSCIVNGIDESWDPATDAHLPQRFSAGDFRGKRADAELVRTRLCLAPSEGPLFGIISRLVRQEGLDLVAAVAGDIVREGGQIAMLGLGEPETELLLSRLARRHRDHIGVLVGFNEPMAHRLLAGSDFLLMPSRFEPCGLTQMQAQRMGTLPIAHATGGLADTIEDGATGFLFPRLGPATLLAACRRAFEVFRDPPGLAAMRAAAMARPSGWDRAARQYLELYARLTGKRTPQPRTMPELPALKAA